ncbi:tetratricopeptide repeat protein [Marivirga sp. S37H4]|uniref:Tetratricopeptide repeat protein n=1 Tax=Marivirga aurantiaca TaxID=2802615 RepID=A0A935C8S6_9BACT|nr:tetratricopeptide repeat protein [Marivirga aurantiaca]MBK6263863.1 tetratricopeptide repeat protein [Marivirga aurantiaca]
MKKILPILFLFFTFCSDKQTDTTQEEWIEMSKKFSGFIDKDEFDSALSIANNRMRIAESSSNDLWKADANNDLGLILMYFGQLEKSEKYYIKSIDYHEDAGTLYGLSLVQRRLGKYDEAYLNATKSYELYRSDSTTKQEDLNFSKLSLASILNGQQKFEESAKLVNEVILFAQHETDSTLLMESMDMLGSICVYSGQPEKAHPLYKKLIKYYESQDLPIKTAESYNDLGTVFHQQNEYDSAIAYYRKSMELKLQRTQDSSIILVNLANIANAYGRLNEPDKEKELRSLIDRIKRQ